MIGLGVVVIGLGGAVIVLGSAVKVLGGAVIGFGGDSRARQGLHYCDITFFSEFREVALSLAF